MIPTDAPQVFVKKNRAAVLQSQTPSEVGTSQL